METYYEYIVKKKKGVKEIVIIASVLISLPIFLIISTVILGLYVSPGLAFIVDAGLIIGTVFAIKTQNAEFEYILTNAELDIDKIMNKKRRKRVISINSKTFEILAPTYDVRFANDEHREVTNVIDASSSPKSERAYFALFSKEGQTYKLIFEPSDNMLDTFSVYLREKLFRR